MRCIPSPASAMLAATVGLTAAVACDAEPEPCLSETQVYRADITTQDGERLPMLTSVSTPEAETDHLIRDYLASRPPPTTYEIEVYGARPGRLRLDCVAAGWHSLLRARAHFREEVDSWIQDTGDHLTITLHVQGLADGIRFGRPCPRLRAAFRAEHARARLDIAEPPDCNTTLAVTRGLICHNQITEFLRPVLAPREVWFGQGFLEFERSVIGRTHHRKNAAWRGVTARLTFELRSRRPAHAHRGGW